MAFEAGVGGWRRNGGQFSVCCSHKVRSPSSPLSRGGDVMCGWIRADRVGQTGMDACVLLRFVNMSLAFLHSNQNPDFLFELPLH